MKIKLTICYDGTHFNGWQIQPNKRTVQEEIEKALFTLTGEKIKITGSGRTDAGVHAKGQIASFSIEETSIKPERFSLALNTILPNDVKVLKSECAPDDFNARYSAKNKTYEYSFYLSETENPLYERYALRVNKSVDVDKMKEATKVFIGEKDFKCFLKSGSDVKDTVREIYDAKIEEKEDLFVFTVTGSGFLYNMIRCMVGALLSIGEGKFTKEDLEKIIETKDREKAGRTVPGKGLCLVKVEY